MRLKWHDFDSSFDARSMYYDQMGGSGQYFADYDQNVWMLEKMKEMGYASGIRKFKSKDGYAWTQEAGGELIRTSDGAMLTPVGNGGTIFSADKTNTLYDFASNPEQYINSLVDSLPNATISGGGANIQIGDVIMDLSNVTDYNSFKNQLMNDSNYSKYLTEAILGQALGNNSLTKNKYRR